MGYWWFDWTSSNQVPRLEGFGELMRGLGVEEKRLVDPPANEVRSCTCFVHTNRRVEWEVIADPAARRFVIFVSSDPDSIPIPQRRGVYALRIRLPRVANLLEREPERLDRFKRSCEAGKPDISCFGHPPHEHLIAAYLIGISKANSSLMESINLPGDLWKQAQSEYCALGGDTGTASKMEKIAPCVDARGQ